MAKEEAIPQPDYVGWKEVGGWDERDQLSSNEEVEDLLQRSTLIETYVSETYYGDWYHNTALIVFSSFLSWLVARLGGGIAWLAIVLAFTGTAYRTSVRRLRRNTRDDVVREMALRKLETDTETLEWMNTFLVKFWLIYEPVLASTVIQVANQVLSSSTPGFIESLSLDTFTLGTKPPRVDHVRTYPKSDEDVAVMDWKFSFTPNDTEDLTARQLKSKVNPKVVLGVRVGKGVISKSLPILVENMSFSGLMRIRIKMMTAFPNIKTVDISFLEPPSFDFVLKPIGGEAFGFDINIIPGLTGFITEMVHANLGPMLYAPNAFQLNIEQMLAGAGVDSAIGVVAVTVHYAKDLKGSEQIGNTVDPYIKFAFNEREELARSEIKSDTKNPTWNETKYLLVKNLNEVLSLTLVDFNDFRKDKVIGSVNFPLETLKEKPEQETINSAVLSAGKNRGGLVFDVRFFPVLEGKTLPDGTKEPPPESETGIVTFTVHQSKELDAKKSMVGQLSPYVDMLLNGRLIDRSRTLKRTNNPVWDNSYEFLVSNKHKSNLGVEIKDARGLSVDPVVGSYSISLNNLLSSIEAGEDWFDLTPTGRVRLSAVWKPVAMKGVIGGTATYVEPIGVLRFHFKKATGLPNLDTIGKVDPYIRVLVGGFQKARTTEIANTADPDWDEIVYATVQNTSQNVIIEALDSEKSGKDRSLGSFNFKAADYMKKNDKGEYIKSDFVDLKGTFALSRKPAKGHLDYSVQFLPSMMIMDPDVAAEKKKTAEKEAEERQKKIESGEIDLKKETKEKAEKEKEKELEEKEKEKAGALHPPAAEEEEPIEMPLEQQIKHDSGVLAFTINSVEGAEANTYLRVHVDKALHPAWVSGKLKGGQNKILESADAMIRELEWSRVTFSITEKRDVHHEHYLAQLNIPTMNLLQDCYAQDKIVKLTRSDEGPPVSVKLRARYFPVSMKVHPIESINNMGILRVDILDAADLPAADRSGKSDPYAVFKYNNKKIFKTKTIKKTLDPEWNEYFEFELVNRQHDKLVIDIYDWDMGPNEDDFLGSVVLKASDLEPMVARVQSLPLDGKSGSVRVKLSFKPEFVARKVRSNELGATFTGTIAPAGKMLTSVGGAGTKVIGEIGGGAYRGGSFLKNTLVGRKKHTSSNGDDSRSVHDDAQSVSSLSHGKSGSSSVDANDLKPGQLTLVSASGFENVNHLQVRVFLVGRKEKEIFKSKAVKTNGGVTRFDESVAFKAPKEGTNFAFRVRDHKSLGRDEDLGEAFMNLAEIVGKEQMVPIEGHGQLAVSVNFQMDG